MSELTRAVQAIQALYRPFTLVWGDKKKPTDAEIEQVLRDNLPESPLRERLAELIKEYRARGETIMELGDVADLLKLTPERNLPKGDVAAPPQESTEEIRKRYDAEMAKLETPITQEDRVWNNGYRQGWLAAQMKAEAPAEPHLTDRDGPCAFCGEITNSLHGNPGLWPLRFCHPDGTGKVKTHHTKCVTNRLFRAPAEPVAPRTTPFGHLDFLRAPVEGMSVDPEEAEPVAPTQILEPTRERLRDIISLWFEREKPLNMRWDIADAWMMACFIHNALRGETFAVSALEQSAPPPSIYAKPDEPGGAHQHDFRCQICSLVLTPPCEPKSSTVQGEQASPPTPGDFLHALYCMYRGCKRCRELMERYPAESPAPKKEGQ